MTSVTGKPRGFTLLETIIVLGIIALMTGFFLIRFDDSQAEDYLVKASSDIKAAAHQAKRRSYAFREDQFIRFHQQGFELADRPFNNSNVTSFFPDEDGVISRYPLPPGVLMELLPHGSRKWQRLKNYTWTFRDSGLSEPLGVRFRVGKSYSELQFNVLTGLAEETTVIE